MLPLPSRFLYAVRKRRPIPIPPRCPPCQYVTVGTDDNARPRAQCRRCHQPPLTQ